MKILKWVLLTAFIFLLQTQFTTLKDFLNITVTLVYYFGLRCLQNISARDYSVNKVIIASTAFGAAVGLAEDIITGPILGPGVLSKGLVGFITPAIFTSVVFRWTPLWGGIILVLLTVLDGVALAGSRILFTGIQISGITVFHLLVVQPLMNIPFGMVVRP